MSELKQNKWQHGLTRFEIPALDDFMGIRDGFLPLPVILDPAAGEEVGLFVRDQTPFMDELSQTKPFSLMMKNGYACNDFGPLAFILFWVENPANPAEPLSSWDCYLDPKNETQMRLWRNLSAQTHWHLFLVGAAGKQRGFFEFENNYGLGGALDFFEDACRNIGTVDFNRAKERFMSENTIEDLFRMQPPTLEHPAKKGKSDKWEEWFATVDFRRWVQEFADKHRGDPQLSAEEYLGQKGADLAGELEDQELIYLDTKYWVNLRHVVVQSPLLIPIYDEILGLLELLRQKKRICCPMSSALFEELMKQSDTSTRLKTARMMDYLSGGVCIQNWLHLIEMEFARHVYRTLKGGDANEATFPIWTKTGYWAGEHTVTFPHLPGQDSVAMVKAAKWRDTGRCVISGFHSPVEKECLQILLRGTQPIIICPARSLPRRVPPEWQQPLAAGRLLVLSPFTARENRVTADLATRRNEFVAALANEVFIVHATAGGHLDSLSHRLRVWGIPLIKPSPFSHANASKHSN